VKNRGKSVSWIRHSYCPRFISCKKNVQKRVYHWNIFQNNWNKNWYIKSESVIDKLTGILHIWCLYYVNLLFIVNTKLLCLFSAISIFFWLNILYYIKQMSLFCEVASKMICILIIHMYFWCTKNHCSALYIYCNVHCLVDSSFYSIKYKKIVQ
jgi:hypothetical protein